MQGKNRKIMFKKIVSLVILILPAAYAISLQASEINVQEGVIADIGIQEISTNFGMVTGTINFKLANYSWHPEEIWLLPEKIDPDEFSKGLTIQTTLELPENISWSTCRTAVYYNSSIGYGFKIYNTGATTQILENGTFCGLAFNGTYYVYATY